MIGKLLPIFLALIGLGAGIGGGVMLRPPPQEQVTLDNACGDVGHTEADTHDSESDSNGEEGQTYDYVKLNNQFVVPVVEDGRVAALVVMSLSLEVVSGQTEAVYQMEPKLRDKFLSVLFDHANAGGFEGSFTKSTRMNSLRMALRETARKALGNSVSDVLIIDVVRQDT